MQATAVVTGGSSGIGAAACRRLRADGWHVIGLARRPSPDASASVLVDIARFDDVLEAFDAPPPVQLLVHAAAILGPIVPLQSSDPDAWAGRTVEVNLLGTYNVLRAALAGPLASDRSTAIHLTSGAASKAEPYHSAYSATKAGAHLVRSAATDVAGSNRAVCSLDRGITETAMQQQLRDRERFIRTFEERTYRTPEEVADAIWELSQPEPSAINGQTFNVGAL